MKLLLIPIIIAIIIFFLRRKKPTNTSVPNDQTMDEMLSKNVRFYRNLSEDEKLQFRTRVQHFLDTTAITPVGKVNLTELDKLYVGSSAIIPIFSFKDWAYNNLNEVLIYPEYFTKDFDTKNEEKNVMGMVGDGAMHRMMILSLPALRAGFEQNGAGNTGIHEFVHLLDKADGATDGLPEYMIPNELVQPWIKYMNEAIREIKSRRSGLNPYAATNTAEFFAVASEYFFQKPQLLEQEHPELFDILEQVYKVEPEGMLEKQLK